MEINTRKYNDPFSAYRKAYFGMKKPLQFERAQKFRKEVKDDIAKYEETITELKGKTLEDISRNNPEKSNDVQPLNSDGNQSNSQEFKAGVTYIFSKSLA